MPHPDWSVPASGKDINMEALGELLWQMFNKVPMNAQGSMLLANIMETVGMELIDYDLYTTEVCATIDEMAARNMELR